MLLVRTCPFLGLAQLESSLSVGSFLRLSCSTSPSGSLTIGSVVTVMQFALVGSAISVRSFARFGSSLSVEMATRVSGDVAVRGGIAVGKFLL